MPRQPSCAPFLQKLERRELMSVTVGHDGNVTAATSTGNTDIVVRLDPSNPANLQVYDASVVQTIALASVKSVRVNGSAGNDRLFIDNTNGFVAQSSHPLNISFDGHGGNDQILLLGTAGGLSLTQIYTLGDDGKSGRIVTQGGGFAQAVNFNQVQTITDVVPTKQTTFTPGNQPDLIQLTNGTDLSGLHTGLLSITPVQVQKAKGGKKHQTQPTTLVPNHPTTAITFADKAAVTVNGGKGEDYFEVNMPNTPVQMTSLSLNGGKKSDLLAEEALPASVSFSQSNFENVQTTPTFVVGSNPAKPDKKTHGNGKENKQ